MPPYFLTAVVAEGFGDLLSDRPKRGSVFHQTDSRLVAEKLVELFRHAESVDLAAPIIEVVDGADLGLPERVFYRQDIGVLDEIEACNDWDPEVWADGGLPHDKGTVLLMRLRYQAQQWEPLVRDELGVDGTGADSRKAASEHPAEAAPPEDVQEGPGPSSAPGSSPMSDEERTESQAPKNVGETVSPRHVDPDERLSPASLAKALGLPWPHEALRKRLERFRKTHLDDFWEMAGRKPTEPQFLYRAGAVLPLLEDLKASSKTSGKRPAQKKTR